MATQARADAYSASQAQVVLLAHSELQAFWKALDATDPVAAKASLIDYLIALIESYGPISATIAADYYDEIREVANVAGRFLAQPADVPSAAQIREVAKWASQPLFKWRKPITNAAGKVIRYEDREPDLDAALERFMGASQRLVQAAGRATLVESVKRDPAKPKFARVPHGDTCDWCIMLASRGAVYRSERSAGGLEDFHDWCDCQVFVAYPGTDLPYDRDAALERYLAIRAKGAKRDGTQPLGFDAMTVSQIQNQINITEGLKESDWRTAQMKRLRARLAELR